MNTYILCAAGSGTPTTGPGGYAWDLWENSVTNGNEVCGSAGGKDDTTTEAMALRALLDGLQDFRDGIIEGRISTPATLRIRMENLLVLYGIFHRLPDWKANNWTNKGGLPNVVLWKAIDAVKEDIAWRQVTMEGDTFDHKRGFGDSTVRQKAWAMPPNASSSAFKRFPDALRPRRSRPNPQRQRPRFLRGRRLPRSHRQRRRDVV